MERFYSWLLAKPLTLAEGLERKREDNFLLLRHFAAALLIYSHSYALAPAAAGESDIVAAFLPGFYGGRVAVFLFFAISGFLVTSSYLRRPALMHFIRARILRVYPAYVVCLLVTVLITGLGFSSLSRQEFFTNADTWHYLLHNLGLTGLRYTLPGAYGASAYDGVVNGSLWSLALEVRLYLYVILIAMLGLLRRRGLALLLFVGFVGYACWVWPGLPPDSESKRALTMVFAATAAAACLAKYFPVSTRMLLLLAVSAWLLRDTACAYGLTIAGITYFSFWFAYRLPYLPLRFPGDYSYGLFLYGFPAQQMIVELRPGISPWLLTFYALGLALAFAVLSWHLVEKRALSLKQSPKTPPPLPSHGT